MAFVYRNKKVISQADPNEPGPTTYYSRKVQKQQINNNRAVTFVDRSKRQIWKKSEFPGPGHYENQQSKFHQGKQILFKTASNDFIVISQDGYNNVKGCSSSFKSKSKRLFEHKPPTPGPGQYNPTETLRDSIVREKSKNKVQKPSQLSRYLFQQSRKKGFTEGYSDSNSQPINLNNQHEKNQWQVQKKQTHFKQKKNLVKSNMFCSKVERKFIQRPITSVGPGSYNIANSYQALDKRSKKIVKQRPCSSVSEKENQCAKVTMFTLSKQQAQKLGPGSYNIQASSFNRKNPSSSKGIACFGSRQSRFVVPKSAKLSSKNDSPGPFSYNIKNNSTKLRQNQSIVRKNVPFMTGAQKNVGIPVSNSSNKNICPGYYQIKNNLFDQIIKNNEKKQTTSKFGSSVQRFQVSKKQNGQNLTQSINLSISKTNSEIKPQKNHKKTKSKFKRISSAFASDQKNTNIHQKQDCRPLCYDSDSQTLNKKYKQKTQIDAPFMGCEQRFKTQQKNFQQKILKQFEENTKSIRLISGNPKSRKQQISKLKKGVNAINRLLKHTQQTYVKNNTRKMEWQEKQNLDVGPQSYNPVRTQNNKSYNVLFRNS